MEIMLLLECLFCESQNLAMDLLTFAEGLSYTKSSAIFSHSSTLKYLFLSNSIITLYMGVRLRTILKILR